MKKLMKNLLSAMLVISAIFVVGEIQVFAVEYDDPQWSTSMSNEAEQEEEEGIMLLSGEEDPYTGLIYTHDRRYSKHQLVYGIDVSSHNHEIDWKKVKADGIEYAIIRAAYRGYGSTGTLNADANFKENIEGALNAGLRVGVYIFSQAITKSEAVEEAQLLIEMTRKYDVTLPFVMDFEFASTSSGLSGRLYQAGLSKEQGTSICKAFCDTIAAKGFVPMIYANKSMLTDHLNAAELENKYKIWLANYMTQSTYTGRYDVWQYTSHGSVDGITGNVDCDFWYEGHASVYNGRDYADVYDFTYYTSKYPDIKKAYGEDDSAALKHFVTHGMKEGRQGCEEFHVTAYKNRYADLKMAYGNDLEKYYLHYLNSGKKEGRIGTEYTISVNPVTIYNGRDYKDVYEFEYYISKYPDVKNAYGADPDAIIRHFVNYGMKEGRQGKEEFCVDTYRNRYSDLRVAYGNNLEKYYLHYLNSGKTEGRSGSGSSPLMNPITVYQGIDYADVYEFTYYTSKYPDIKKAYGNDESAVLKHFVNHGMKEGRQAAKNFEVNYYRATYADLQKAYGDSLQKYYMHYINSGKNEGRQGIRIN